jgi:putative FmdB family regulatory protein
MPVYTYRCENCGVQFEQHQKFSDTPLSVCPECGKKKLRKVYTAVGIVFKGSGFYSTDHKSPSGMKYGTKSEEKTDATSGGKSAEVTPKTETAAETKPAPAAKSDSATSE